MKKAFLFLNLFIISPFIFSQHIPLSKQAEISVLTVGPGTSLNDAFGHNAFRIKDPKQFLDITFDYGRYDFEAPNFYLNFTKGKLNYEIGNAHFYDFIQFYISENRTIKEQILNLSTAEKQTLFDYLVENNKPENKAYLYEFFFDNCATKIKDVVSTTLNNSVDFNPPSNFKPKTFRTLIHNNLNKNSWGSFGIDLALGSVIDQKATPEEHMFLPENIYTFFKASTIKNNLPLVKENKILFQELKREELNSFFTSPLFIFGLIAMGILFLTYTDYKNHKQTKWLDVALFSTTGLIGVLILLLWFATDHSGTKHNYNLLWAFALNVFVVGQFFKHEPSLWFVKYLKLLVILLCLLALHWFIGVQVFAIALIPILIALLIRYVFLISILSKD